MTELTCYGRWHLCGYLAGSGRGSWEIRKKEKSVPCKSVNCEFWTNNETFLWLDFSHAANEYEEAPAADWLKSMLGLSPGTLYSCFLTFVFHRPSSPIPSLVIWHLTGTCPRNYMWRQKPWIKLWKCIRNHRWEGVCNGRGGKYLKQYTVFWVLEQHKIVLFLLLFIHSYIFWYVEVNLGALCMLSMCPSRVIFHSLF